MELLAHVWGSDEAKEGMNAFLAGRAPHLLDGYECEMNAPPARRRKPR